MIIGISGKIGSGKDTAAMLINYIATGGMITYTGDTEEEAIDGFIKYYDDGLDVDEDTGHIFYPWEIVKFADKIKDIVCILIGCTRDQLEDTDFKNQSLGVKWIRYEVLMIGKGITKVLAIKDTLKAAKVMAESISGDFRGEYREVQLTPRLLMQLLGTECGRNIIHPNIWVNATMNDYKSQDRYTNIEGTASDGGYYNKKVYTAKFPDWIISDVRFPNEVEAIKREGGKIIRIMRPLPIGTKFKTTFDGKTYTVLDVTPSLKIGTNWCYIINKKSEYVLNTDVKYILNNNASQHESEIALDDYDDWDYVIENDGTIYDLCNKLKVIPFINTYRI